jgi:D-alanyl-D-alanine dipeptidase
VCDCVISAALRYLSGSSNWIDMGTGYDCLDSLASADNGRIHGKQRANRLKGWFAVPRQGLTGGVITPWK